MKTLTIFTPTYNRAYIISNLYKSLKRQSNKDFCWLVVDDGSTDGTDNLIQSFALEGIVEIEYLKKANGGKTSAMMVGIQATKTELYCCVDSDDYLTDDAVEKIVVTYQKHKSENLLGIYFRQVSYERKNIATPYPKGITRCGITDLYDLYGFSGDTAIVLKTELIKPYGFPTFPGEKFITERSFYILLNKIAPMLLMEDGIYVSTYLEDGYTRNAEKLTYKNPYGCAYSCLIDCTYSPIKKKCIKQYAQYKGIVAAFSLDRSLLRKYNKTKIIYRIAALPFVLHYRKLYRMIIDRYE